MNYFTLLEQAENLVLDLDQLKESFQQKAASSHPDKGGDEEIFKQLNRAYEALRVTHLRIRHLFEVRGIDFNPRGSVSNEVMDFFMPVGELIQEVDQHLRQLNEASSALTKAMLAPKSMELQAQIEAWISKLETAERNIEDRLLALQVEADPVQVAVRDLAFLFKWRSQLRERYAGLFSL